MWLFLNIFVFCLLFRDATNKAVHYSMTDEGKDEGFGVGNIQAPEIRIEDDNNETLIALGIVSVLLVIAIAVLFSVCYHKRRDLLLWMAKDDNVLASRFIKSENAAEADTKPQTPEPKVDEPPPEPEPPPKPKLTVDDIKAMLKAKEREERRKAAMRRPRPVRKESTPSRVPKALPGMLEGVLFVTELAEETQKRVKEKEEEAVERRRLEDSDSQREEDQPREDDGQPRENELRPKKSRRERKKSKSHRRRSRVEE